MPTLPTPYGALFTTRASWGVATLRAALTATLAERRWLCGYACDLLAGVYGD